MATAALKLITPTSVAKTGAGSSATIGTNGKVTFGSCATLSLNGIFSSTHDDYMLVIQYTNGTGNTQYIARLRASGTDATGADYTYQKLLATSTSVSGARVTGATEWYMGQNSSTARNGDTYYFYGPNLAQATAYRTLTCGGTSSAYIEDYAGTHSLSTQYDGLTIDFLNAATGTLTVYGLSQ